MYYSDEILEEVRSRNDIVSVISQYVKLTKRGGNYFGLCPFHNEKTPSFSVSPGKQMYYCFGCGAGGNVISFIMEYESCSFTEAVRTLAERAGMTLPEAEDSGEKVRSNRKNQLLEINRQAAVYYHYQLKSPAGARALAYLTGRGLTPETIQRFGLGYSLPYMDSLYKYLKQKKWDDELLRDSGLVKIDEKGVRDRFWNRVMYPIMDIRSRVIGFGGRVMGEGEPKYLNSPETELFDKSRNLYGLHIARASRRPYLLLCEGYMDVITLQQAGFDCAVASLGTALTPGHALLLKRYTKDVILTYDSDGAGRNAALRALPILKNAGIDARVLSMNPYKDPDEFIRGLGAEEYEKRITAALNSFLYEMDMKRQQYDLNDPQKKTEFHRELAARLTAFPDELERNNYLEAAAARYRISPPALQDLVSRSGGRTVFQEREPAETPARTKKAREKDEGIRQAECLVLNWLSGDSGRYADLKGALEPEDFTGEVFIRTAGDLFTACSEGRQLQPAALLDRYADEEEKRNQIAQIFNTVLPEDCSPDEKRKIISGSIRRIKRNALDRAIREETDPRRLQQLIVQRSLWEQKEVPISDAGIV